MQQAGGGGGADADVAGAGDFEEGGATAVSSLEDVGAGATLQLGHQAAAGAVNEVVGAV